MTEGDFKWIRVYECQFIVEVAKAKDQSNEDFDAFIDKNYFEIESVFAVDEAFKEVLTNPTGVLKGYDVKVRLKH